MEPFLFVIIVFLKESAAFLSNLTVNLSEIEYIRKQAAHSDWSAMICEKATIADLDKSRDERLLISHKTICIAARINTSTDNPDNTRLLSLLDHNDNPDPHSIPIPFTPFLVRWSGYDQNNTSGTMPEKNPLDSRENGFCG